MNELAIGEPQLSHFPMNEINGANKLSNFITSFSSGDPFFIAVAGPMGAGKTTLAEMINKKCLALAPSHNNLVIVDQDNERERSLLMSRYGVGFDPDVTSKDYQEAQQIWEKTKRDLLWNNLTSQLHLGRSVICTSTFPTLDMRQRLQNVAKRNNYSHRFMGIWLNVEIETSLERQNQRPTHSDNKEGIIERTTQWYQRYQKWEPSINPGDFSEDWAFITKDRYNQFIENVGLLK